MNPKLQHYLTGALPCTWRSNHYSGTISPTHFVGRRLERVGFDFVAAIVRTGLDFAFFFATGGFEPVFAFFSTRFLWAVWRAPRTTSSLATARFTCVAPPRPQPPGTGMKISGSSSTKAACCSGLIMMLP